MNRFIRDIFFTSLLCTFFIVVIDFFIVNTPNEYNYKDWYLTENADKIKILILGNSLFANSFNPNVIGDSTFDGAGTGRRQFYDVLILKKYVPTMHNLQTIIIPILPYLFVEYQPELYNRFPYARYMDIPVGNNILQYSPLFSGHFTFRDIIPRPIVPQITKKSAEPYEIDSMGYSPMFRIWKKRTNPLTEKTYEQVMASSPFFINQITEMAKDCNQLGIRFICIMPPFTDVYNESVGQRTYNSLDSIMLSLSKSLNFEYNFYNDSPDFRADSLYADDHHLNHCGATLFAQRVKEDFGL